MREADMILMGFNSVWEAVQCSCVVSHVSSTGTFLADGSDAPLGRIRTCLGKQRRG